MKTAIFCLIFVFSNLSLQGQEGLVDKTLEALRERVELAWIGDIYRDYGCLGSGSKSAKAGQEQHCRTEYQGSGLDRYYLEPELPRYRDPNLRQALSFDEATKAKLIALGPLRGYRLRQFFFYNEQSKVIQAKPVAIAPLFGDSLEPAFWSPLLETTQNLETEARSVQMDFLWRDFKPRKVQKLPERIMEELISHWLALGDAGDWVFVDLNQAFEGASTASLNLTQVQYLLEQRDTIIAYYDGPYLPMLVYNRIDIADLRGFRLNQQLAWDRARKRFVLNNQHYGLLLEAYYDWGKSIGLRVLFAYKSPQ